MIFSIISLVLYLLINCVILIIVLFYLLFLITYFICNIAYFEYYYLMANVDLAMYSVDHLMVSFILIRRSQVQAELQNSFLKRMIFNMGMRAKETEIKKSIVRMNSMWDKIVFKKIQESMGGRLRLMLVGSAPLAGNVLTFTRCALGCVVVEGYGQTECTAPITLTIQVCILIIDSWNCSRDFTVTNTNISTYQRLRSFQKAINYHLRKHFLSV